jgi:hypothetical protein
MNLLCHSCGKSENLISVGVSFLLYEGSCNVNILGIKDYYKVLLTDQAGNYIDKDQIPTPDEK